MQRSPWPILLLALLSGLVFVFLVPPWQHYDEPNHFEYAWLVAHKPGWPQEGEFDREMRVATLQSMIEHNFFRGMGFTPSLESEEPWIGAIPQIGDSPLYYWLAAWPLKLFSPLEITTQLYAARMVSLLLFVLTVYLAWATTRLLVSKDSPLRWMVPAFFIALPAFVDIMTAINNDVAAIVAFTLLLYTATYLIVRGWHWQHFLLLLLAGVLCILAKRTVFFAIVLIPIALLFAIFQGKKTRWAWLLIAVGGTLAFVASFRYGDAAAWYRRTPQQLVTRAIPADSPFDSNTAVLRLQIANNDPSYQLLQFLPTETVPKLAGKTVTIGAWMWSTASVNIQAPRLILINKATPPISQGEAHITLEPTPRFYTWTFDVPVDSGKRAWVQFGPAIEAPTTSTEVFIEDAILTIGDYFGNQAPQWQEESNILGTWNGQTVENLLRGSSAEGAWINPRPWADKAWSKIFGYSGHQWASFVFYTLRDWPGTGWYYRLTGESLFRTFWAVFGWGHVFLLGSKPYRWLLIFSIILTVAAIWGLWQRRRSLRWNVVVFFAIATGAIWGLTIVRGAHHVLSGGYISIPVARYAYPALFPLAALFSLGALAGQNILERILPPLRRVPGILWGLFLTGLTIWAWISLYVYYY